MLINTNIKRIVGGGREIKEVRYKDSVVWKKKFELSSNIEQMNNCKYFISDIHHNYFYQSPANEDDRYWVLYFINMRGKYINFEIDYRDYNNSPYRYWKSIGNAGKYEIWEAPIKPSDAKYNLSNFKFKDANEYITPDYDIIIVKHTSPYYNEEEIRKAVLDKYSKI